MTPTSVLAFLPNNNSATKKTVREQIATAINLVTEGRYLIAVYESRIDWESHLPIESFVIDQTLGGIQNRSSEWVHGIGNLVLLFPQDNRGLQDKMPNEKKKTYLQHPIYLTKTVSGIDGLDEGDQKKINKLLKEAGITTE
jgi:hypothetical protein